MQKLLVIMICFIFLSACAAPGQQAKLEGAGMGALIGAGVGATIGAIACGSNCAAIGAAIGGGVGTIGGLAYADSIEKHHNALKGKENDLDTQIKVANNINGDMQAMNQEIQTKITQLNQDISSLQAEAKNQKNTKEKLAAKKQQINKEQNDVARALESAKKERDSIVSFRSSSTQTQQSNELKKLEAEHARLEENIKQMEQHSYELASMSQRL